LYSVFAIELFGNCLENLFGKFIWRSYPEKLSGRVIWKSYLEELSGRVIWRKKDRVTDCSTLLFSNKLQ